MWNDGHVFTANIIWCEEKYVVSGMIAEFWNSVSNLLFVVLGVCMIWNGIKVRVPGRLLVCYVGLCAVGIGSFLFHATLRYECQLMDEFPMMLLASHAVFCLVTNAATRITIKLLWLAGIYSTVAAALVAYTRFNTSLFFQVLFGTLTCALLGIAFRAWWLAPRRRHAGVSFGQCMLLSASFTALAFALWLIDVHSCMFLRTWRAVLGRPWIALLQLHAWWHVLTSLGAAWLTAALTLADPFRSPSFAVYRRYGVFPVTRRADVAETIVHPKNE